MSDFNPYQSPSNAPMGHWEGETGQTEVDAVLYEATQSLAQTKPWVRFLSVLGFLASAFSIVGFAIVAAVQQGPPFIGMQLVIMIPFAILFYFIPSVLLWSYASRIGEFMRMRNPATFAAAISAQKSFWKYVGVVVLVVLGLYFVFIAFAVLMAAAGAF